MRASFWRGPCLAAAMVTAGGAVAHPHVWVSTRTAILFEPGGRISGLRHDWTFDKGYSEFALQGLELKGGQPTPAALRELAQLNVSSLGESGYFTIAKAGGRKVELAEPAEPALSVADGSLTLSYTLRFKEPASAARAFTLDIYDPSWFVDFTIDERDDAVRLVGAPQGCVLRVTRPKPQDVKEAQNVSESFFAALNRASDFGARFGNKVVVACP